MTLWHISTMEFAALALAAVIIGFSKTAVSGASAVSLAILAAILPARASTGVMLPLLMVGDVFAVLTYRRHAHWPTLWRLFPAVAAGVVAGTLFLMWADDGAVRISIGTIMLGMIGLTLWKRRRVEDVNRLATVDGGQRNRLDRVKTRSYGVIGGFTTMVANAGGPPMSMYLLSAGFPKLRFLGTSAIFFVIVNISKVPFAVGLGLINGRSLLLDASLAVFVVCGALFGRWAVRKIDQRLFERLVIAATIIGGLQLLR